MHMFTMRKRWKEEEEGGMGVTRRGRKGRKKRKRESIKEEEAVVCQFPVDKHSYQQEDREGVDPH